MIGEPFSQIIFNNSDDGREISLPYDVRDEYDIIKESSLWWDVGDTTLHRDGSDNQGFSFLSLPYFPFFSNCKGYDSHMSVSRLIEDHPNCTLIDPRKTVAVSQ